MSVTTAFSICLAALNTKFKLYPARTFQHKTLSERKDGNYVRLENCVVFVAAQIGGDGQESKRGDKKKKPRGLASVCGTGVRSSCFRFSNR
jgi:hypothetical protein